MKIIIPMLTISSHGGCRVLIHLANQLVLIGHEVEIITTRIEPIPYIIDDRVVIKLQFHRMAFQPLRFICFLLRICLVKKCNIILSNHFLTYFPSQISAYLFGHKNVYFIQGIEAECIIGLPKYLICFLKYINYKSFRSKNIVSANPYLSQRIKDYGNVDFDFNLGVSKEHLLHFDSLNFSSKEYDIVYFGRFEENKGLDRFFNILKCSNNFKYLVITQDSRVVCKLTQVSSVTVVQPIDDAELYRYIDSARVCLLTSYSEGFALPPLESMFRGVPLIYFECGGPSVYTNNNNSILIDDVNDYTFALNKIIENYRMYSHGAIETANDFILEESTNKFERYLREVSK